MQSMSLKMGEKQKKAERSKTCALSVMAQRVLSPQTSPVAKQRDVTIRYTQRSQQHTYIIHGVRIREPWGHRPLGAGRFLAIVPRRGIR